MSCEPESNMAAILFPTIDYLQRFIDKNNLKSRS